MDEHSRKRLTKSRTHRQIDGVLGGIADYFGWDPTVVRIIFILMMVPSFGTMVVVYIVLDLIMPTAPHQQEPRPKRPVTPDSRTTHDDDWSDF